MSGPLFFGWNHCDIHDVDQAMLAYGIGGQLVTEEVDTSHPAFEALQEVINAMSQYRRPPNELVEEMHRRMQAVKKVLMRQAARGVAMSN